MKMLAEYEAQYGSNNIWTRPKIHGNRPLMMSHIAPAFIAFGITITVSLIVFVTELWFGRKQSVGGRRHRREARLEGGRRVYFKVRIGGRGMVLRGIEDKTEVY